MLKSSFRPIDEESDQNPDTSLFQKPKNTNMTKADKNKDFIEYLKTVKGFKHLNQLE